MNNKRDFILERNTYTLTSNNCRVRMDFVEGSLIFFDLKNFKLSTSIETSNYPYTKLSENKFLTYEGDTILVSTGVSDGLEINLNTGVKINILRDSSVLMDGALIWKFPVLPCEDEIEGIMLFGSQDVGIFSKVACQVINEITAEFRMKALKVHRAYSGGAIFEEFFVDDNDRLLLATNMNTVFDTLDTVFNGG